MESFFASLKKELVHDAEFATREEARAALFESIEVFYNRVRRHSALGYLSCLYTASLSPIILAQVQVPSGVTIVRPP
jgi:putative transposase